jgi:hypothetical protein
LILFLAAPSHQTKEVEFLRYKRTVNKPDDAVPVVEAMEFDVEAFKREIEDVVAVTVASARQKYAAHVSAVAGSAGSEGIVAAAKQIGNFEAIVADMRLFDVQISSPTSDLF